MAPSPGACWTRCWRTGALPLDGLSGSQRRGDECGQFRVNGLRKSGVEGARDQLGHIWCVGQSRRRICRRCTRIRGRHAEFMERARPPPLSSSRRRICSRLRMNPLNINPLRNVLAAQVDFAALRASDHLKLFIFAATNVEFGQVWVFHRPELTLDMVMASACLPTLFRAVEIDGVPYWDGGYHGQSRAFSLFLPKQKPPDVLLVQINPIERKGSHRIDRRNHGTNSGRNHLQCPRCCRNFAPIDFVARLIADGRLEGTHYKCIRLHVIEAQDELNKFGAASRMRSDYDFFLQLRDIGRHAAQKFLDAHLTISASRRRSILQETLV